MCGAGGYRAARGANVAVWEGCAAAPVPRTHLPVPRTHRKPDAPGGGHPHGAEPPGNDTGESRGERGRGAEVRVGSHRYGGCGGVQAQGAVGHARCSGAAGRTRGSVPGVRANHLPPPALPALAQLCGDEGGFDAAALTENGTMLFFRGGAGAPGSGSGVREENVVWGGRGWHRECGNGLWGKRNLGRWRSRRGVGAGGSGSGTGRSGGEVGGKRSGETGGAGVHRGRSWWGPEDTADVINEG